ncbi:hypothetical protein [Catenulispora rubra]|uniref:hypothetical protein n=1 Tax=Catenulispora rubra TaxID=280293 RepID=UPI0018923E2A|nr:hypothetical protein [Catenulispora rubra]
MTAATSAAPLSPAPPSWWVAVRGIWTHGRRIERVCYLLGLVLLASGAFHFALFFVRGGPWEGPVSWRKPTTFGLSFGLTLIAVAWVASYLKLPERTRTPALGVFAADCFVEVGGITLQAWRHVPSHIDMQGSFNTGVSMTLAVGGGILVVVLGRLAVAAFRGDPHQAPSMRLALRAGFATLMIGLLSGAAMIARGTPEAKTGHQQQAYHDLGFLKLVHGISLHGVLVLPTLAWALTLTSWPEQKRTRTVKLAASAYGIAIAAALVFDLATM